MGRDSFGSLSGGRQWSCLSSIIQTTVWTGMVEQGNWEASRSGYGDNWDGQMDLYKSSW